MTKDELGKKIDDELACYWVSTTPTRGLVKYEVAKKFIMDLHADPQPLVTGLDWREIEKEYTTASLGQMEGIVEDIISTLKQQSRWVVMDGLGTDGAWKYVFDKHKMKLDSGSMLPAEAQAECDRRNGEEEVRTKYEAEPSCSHTSDGEPRYNIKNTKSGASVAREIVHWKRDIILDALNAEVGKEGE